MDQLTWCATDPGLTSEQLVVKGSMLHNLFPMKILLVLSINRIVVYLSLNNEKILFSSNVSNF